MMRSGLSCFLATLGATAFLLWAQGITADTIVTKGGSRFEGQVKEGEYWYTLTTPSGGRMTFPKDMVLEVIRPAKNQTEPGDVKGTESVPPPTQVSKATLYTEVPLVGKFGTDILPEGVEQCLRYSAQNPRIKHVVFRIKSPGGKVSAAEKIRDILQQYDERFEYHALVQEAISASIWVVFVCDTIHMADGSSVGAAVIYSENPKTGQIDVDAKTNAIIAAKVASLAAAKGHSRFLAVAMMIREAEAYAWQHNGKVTVAQSLPAGVPLSAFVVHDTAKAVLSLTKQQAVAVGLARPVHGGSEGLGKALGLPGWRKVSNYAENVMLRTKLNRQKEIVKRNAAIRRNKERIEAIITFIRANTAEAVNNDPSNLTTYYDESTGQLTHESRKRWKRQTDIAIGAWHRVQSGIVELRKLEKEAEKLGLKRIIHDLNLAHLYARAGREIARLLGERSRYRL